MKKFILAVVLIIAIVALAGCEQAMREAREACNYDGKLDPKEICDDGNRDTTDLCADCVPTYCGDGAVNNNPMSAQSIVEQCDAALQVDADKQCREAGFETPCNRQSCLCGGIAATPSQGCNNNNRVEAPEECDKGGGDSTCNPDCTLTYCGDGDVQKPNGKDLNNKQPGFDEQCDPGPNPNDPYSEKARAAHAYCQTMLGDSAAMCVGCRCRAPPWSCTAGAFAAAFGPVGPLPPGAVCKDDCATLLGANWKCNTVTCVCHDTTTCLGNTIGVLVSGKNSYTGGACADDCKLISNNLECHKDKCVCWPKPGVQVTCAENTFGALFGNAQWKPGMACQDDCRKVAQSFGVAGKQLDKVFCDQTSCVCKGGVFGDGDEKPPEEPEEDNQISCAANRGLALGGRTPNVPTDPNMCKDDCTDGLYCNEYCVCDDRRVVTPRCGDGYISSRWIGGGGNEECDIGGSSNAAPKPDTCPAPKKCVGCKCVVPTPETAVRIGEDTLQNVCGSGRFLNDNTCGNSCTSNQGCELARSVKEGKCYACYDKCAAGEFYEDPLACQRSCDGRCTRGKGSCYQCEGKRVVTGVPETGVIVGTPTQPQPLNCESECAQRGYGTSPADHSSWILGQLEQERCVSGASIQLPGSLRLTASTGESCTCYSQDRPQISIDRNRPQCQSQCGPVDCDSSRECTIGTTNVRATCSWGGWEQIDQNRFRPRLV